MKLTVYRYSANNESTLGMLFIDGVFQCYTIEDEQRSEKVFGETRIPEGEYNIGLRTVGGHNERYAKTYSFHKGMLHILDVPNFEYVLIHKGNTDDDTAGCLLVGNSTNNNKLTDGFIGDSAGAYVNMYKKVADKVALGECVTIEYINLES